MMKGIAMARWTGRRVAWIAANLVAAVTMPLVIALWSTYLVSGDESSPPEGFSASTFVVAFTGAWLVFLVLLNVTGLLFVWLSRRGE